MNLALAIAEQFVEEGKITEKDLLKMLDNLRKSNNKIKHLTEEQKKINDLKMRLLRRIND